MLASGSPRRRELLVQLGIDVEVRPADVDETPRPGESPGDLVRRLAVAKARAVATIEPDAVVLGADTVVDVDGVIFGKPGDGADARRMLSALSGRTHQVHTAVAVTRPDGTIASEATTTNVTFVELTPAMIDWYVATGEPADKAGGYGLQGIGGVFVERVDGSVSGVLGLPMSAVLRLLG